MNNTEQHVEETIEEHEGLIKTPKQLIVTVILAFLVPVIVIIMLVNLVEATSQSGIAGSDGQTPEAIASRIKPVADFKLVDANAPKVFQTGQQVFETTCTACHTAGVAGAPKMGDQAAWAPLIETGYDELVKAAIHGVGAMPPKGGNAALSDFEVERAVVYMANQSGASFEEPQEPAADQPADAGQAAAGSAAPAAAAAPAQASAPAAASTQAAAAPAAPAAPAEQAAAPATEQAAAPAADAASDNAVGEKIYKSVCIACHASGVAGAPKFGDKEAWAKYIESGMDTMLQAAIHGKGAMPPRGGSQATDAELKAAIQYMVDAVQ